MGHSFIVIITVRKQEPGVNFVLFLLSVDKTGVGLTVRLCLEAQTPPFQKKQNFYCLVGINGLDLDGNHNSTELPRDLVGLVPYCVEGTQRVPLLPQNL